MAVRAQRARGTGDQNERAQPSTHETRPVRLTTVGALFESEKKTFPHFLDGSPTVSVTVAVPSILLIPMFTVTLFVSFTQSQPVCSVPPHLE